MVSACRRCCCRRLLGMTEGRRKTVFPGIILSLHLLLTVVARQVSATGNFQLQLVSFVNEDQLTADGSCCVHPTTTVLPPGGQPSSSDSSCGGQCRPSFRLCLSHYQANLNLLDVACTFGNTTTGVVTADTSTPSGSLRQPLVDIPLNFSFDFRWPGSFSLVVEAWHLDATTGQRVTLICRSALSRLIDASPEWQLFSWNSTNSSSPAAPRLTMSYRYRVICDADHYGTDCSTSCVPRDDKLGHYVCSENGTKMCIHGWTGQYCEQPVCLQWCDSEHGYCEKANECKCRLGWQGTYCNQCIPYPGCQHGTCDQPWQCNCQEGWGGLFCNQDLNFCTNYRPCRNGATCTNTGQGSFTCTCPPGYTGTSCESRTDDCSHVPCQNGGTCSPSDNRCVCRSGYEGAFCERGVAVGCDQQTSGIGPCLNGGSCLTADPGGEASVGYRCACRPGYTGYHCEMEIDECASRPCLNDGKCVDVVDNYICFCAQQFTGRRCETPKGNRCNTSGLRPPCLNGGQCIDVPPDDFECQCPPGYCGSLCQNLVRTCVDRPCLNGATCVALGNDDFFCACAVGYSGRLCTEARQTGSNASTTTAVPSPSPFIVVESTQLTVQQLVLVAVLGGGIPVGALGAAVIALLATRRRNGHRRRTTPPPSVTPSTISATLTVTTSGAAGDDGGVHNDNVMNNRKQNGLKLSGRLHSKSEDEAVARGPETEHIDRKLGSAVPIESVSGRCVKITNEERERRIGRGGQQKVPEVNLLSETTCQCKMKRAADESSDVSSAYLTNYRKHPSETARPVSARHPSTDHRSSSPPGSASGPSGDLPVADLCGVATIGIVRRSPSPIVALSSSSGRPVSARPTRTSDRFLATDV